MDTQKKRKIFISHGHDVVSLLKLRTFLKERLDCSPVILSEMPDDGLTIVEKLEKYGCGCQFAIICLSGDDETKNGGRRARQNVIHELGFFHGTIGRRKVLLCKESGTELFANISGLIYKEYERGRIESIFEDIRRAVESANAEGVGETVSARSMTDAEWGKNAVISLGGELKEVVSRDIIQEIEFYKHVGLSGESLQQKLIGVLRNKIEEEKSAESNLRSHAEERSEENTDNNLVNLYGTLLKSVFIAAQERTIKVLERCVVDLEDSSLDIEDRVSICKKRLEDLGKEGASDKKSAGLE